MGRYTLAGGHRGGCLAYDTGTVTARINNASGYTPFSYVASANWAQNDTAATVAARLASSINAAAGSVVTAMPNTANASSINLYSNSTGPAADFNISVSVTDGMGVLYPYFLANPSFSLNAESMSGGAGADTSYGTIYSYVAGYAPNGNILTHSDSVMGNWNFSYDAVDRLATAAAGASAPSAFQGQSAAWSYDSFGNRTAQSFSNSVYSNWANYNPANNRITAATSGAYTYDASGNTLNDGNNRYWYDAEGQLCAVQSLAVVGLPITQYVYDAEGARIGKGTLSAAPASYTSSCTPFSLDAQSFTLTARYLVDQGGNQVTELSEQSGEVWKHSNVFSAARLTATYDTSGLHYELADPLGTKRVQANISGQIEMSWASLPYGDALTPILPPNPPSTADDATEHHFTQKERDNESGNDYFFARYYNSNMGRFTTPDWSAKLVPIPYAQMGDPQSLNLYAYVRNNPITGVDPDGHMDCSGKNANGIGCQYMAARQWIASAGMAPGATLGETFAMAANITGTALNILQAQQQGSDKNTNIMLYAGVPPTSSGSAVLAQMNWEIVPQANTSQEVETFRNNGGNYASHATIEAIKAQKRQFAGMEVRLLESQRGGPEKWMGDKNYGGGIDQLMQNVGTANQKWYVDGMRVQLVVGADGKGNLIKAWTAHVDITSGRPVYSKVD